MANQRTTDPFMAISDAELAAVSGGRMIPRQGTDPRVIQGIQQLVKTIAEVGQVIAAKNEQSSAQTMQLMQQMMQKRGGS
jgi:hypothetical protein